MRVYYAKATYDNKEIAAVNKVLKNPTALTVSYTHLTLPTTPYV